LDSIWFISAEEAPINGSLDALLFSVVFPVMVKEINRTINTRKILVINVILQTEFNFNIYLKSSISF